MSKAIITIKRGDRDDQGMIFWGIVDGHFLWVTEEQFTQRKRECTRAMRQNAIKNGTAKPPKPRVRETPCDWKKRNPDKHTSSVTQWMKSNPERAKEIRRKANKAYYERHMAKFIDKSSRRKATKIGATAQDHNPAIANVMAECRSRLEQCTGIKWHIDHILPLNAGGLHAHYNLQLLPASLNIRKKDNPKFKLPNCYHQP